jgi:hypothetical protein
MTVPRRIVSTALLLMCAWMCAAGFVAPTAGANWPHSTPIPETSWPRTKPDQFIFAMEPPRSGDVTLSSGSFAIEFGPTFKQAATLTTNVLGGGLDDPTPVYGYLDSTSFHKKAAETPGVLIPYPAVVIDPTSLAIRVDVQAFLSLSPTQQENAISFAVAALATERLGGGLATPEMVSGVALYVALPTQEELARIASNVQVADKDGVLIPWFAMHGKDRVTEVELARSEAYSMVAFLVSRFDFPSLRSWLSAISTAATWQDSMKTSFGVEADQIETNWHDGLPAWTTSGWRDNLMAAFDLQPARDLLASGQYVSAKAVLDSSLNLYRQLNDPVALDQVQALVNEADTGVQAEALMVEVQAALVAHDYERASNLLDQAEIQYGLLPADHVPDSLIATYRQRTNDGLGAMAQLETAKRLARSWGRYPEARAAAKEAGATFARLGDADRRASAEQVMQTLDNRQRRLVILIGTLAITMLAWLTLWLRSRGKTNIKWGYA